YPNHHGSSTSPPPPAEQPPRAQHAVVTRPQPSRTAFAQVSAHIKAIVCLSSAEVRSGSEMDSPLVEFNVRNRCGAGVAPFVAVVTGAFVAAFLPLSSWDTRRSPILSTLA